MNGSRKKTLIVRAVALTLIGTSSIAQAVTYPIQVVSQPTEWKLTLPVPETDTAKTSCAGRYAANAKEVSGTALSTYKDTTHFMLNSAANAIKMYSDYGGATTGNRCATPGTAFARTELRQVPDWSEGCYSGGRKMVMTAAFIAPPAARGNMSGAQIHDNASAGGKGDDILELYYSKNGYGNAYSGVIAKFNDGSSTELLDANYTAGDMFTATITTEKRTDGTYVKVRYQKGTTLDITKEKLLATGYAGCYFKAGNYHQGCSQKAIDNTDNPKCTVAEKGSSFQFETSPSGKSYFAIYNLSVTKN